MSASPNRFFDDMSRLFNDAAGAARSLGREAETAIKTQVERLLAGMDVVDARGIRGFARHGGGRAQRQ